MTKKPLKIDEPPQNHAPDPAADSNHAHHPVSPKEIARKIITKLFFVDLIVVFGVTLYSESNGYTSLSAQQLGLASFGSLFFVAALSALKTYDIRNLYRTEMALGNIAKAAIAWVIVMYALSKYTSVDLSIARIVIGLVLTLGFWRMTAMVMWILRRNVRARMRSRAVVVGWTPLVTQLVDVASGDFTSDLEIIGCVPPPTGEFNQKPPAKVPLIGRYIDLVSMITKRQVDCVLLSENLNQDEFQSLVKICQRSYIDFQVIPSGFPTLRSCLDVHLVAGVPLVGYGSMPLDKVTNRIIKRTVDIIGAIIGLILASPFIVFFCLCVFIESPGAVFYKQRRATRGGKSFFIYKIRSMKPDAESKSGAVWAKKDDDRRLKVGALMRKTNVDELPQFWNVLKGDMSLVGPRPERPELISKFKHSIENYNTRHMVKAGLTGWAAINGWRGDTDLARRIEADVYYMENWSLSLDLYCIIATMFKIKNAY